MPMLLKAKEFEAEILRAEVPVLVDFFGERCMPCRMLRPILVELSEEYAGQIKFYMFDTDRERGETREEYEEKYRTILAYQVMSLPTMLLFVDGKLRRTLIGLHTKEELLEVFAEEGLELALPAPDEEDEAVEQEDL